MSFHITAISSMATRQILADLIGPYEQRTGYQVGIQSMGGVDAARRIRAGEPTDVIILASDVMEQLEAEGHIVSGSRADFARSGIAVAVPSGVPRPRIDDEQSVKQETLKARKICCSSGPSGDHLKRLWKRWGILDLISERAVQAPPGIPVGMILANGEADLGFQQLSELLHVPGIDILGPLPPEIQAMTMFSAGLASASSQPDQAEALIAYLTSPEAEAAKRQHGMEPASVGHSCGSIRKVVPRR
jgi:molybdate transport system substrate-binding protein